MLNRSRWCAAFVAIACQAPACRSESSNVGTAESGTSLGSTTSEDTSHATSGSTSEAASTGSTSSGPESSESSDTGAQDNCPAADLEISASSAGVLTQDWPEGGTVDAPCEVQELSDDKTTLRLSCLHPDKMVPVEVVYSFPPGVIGTQLDGLVGETGVLASFYNEPPRSIDCLGCNDLRLRDAGGDLLVLSNVTRLYGAVPAEGATIDVSAAKWLDLDSPELPTWSAPLGSLHVRHVGCAERASIRPGSDVETPLALEVATDTGLVGVYDRSREYGVEIGGERFDLVVSDAFFRGPLNCGDCPSTLVSFLVVRASS
jgi:hypothetical protein